MKEGAPGALRGVHVAANRAVARIIARVERGFEVRHVSSRRSRASRSHRPSRRRAPLFIVEGDGGCCLDLVRRLGEQQPAYALMAPRVEGTLSRRAIECRAEMFLREIHDVAPRGPYLLGGMASGGWVALEMARRLSLRGHAVPLLLLLDTWGPGYPERLATSRWQRAICRLYRYVGHHTGALILHERRLGYLREALARGPRPEPRIAAGVPAPYAGRAVLVRSTAQPLGARYDRTLGWDRVIRGGIDVIECPGIHDAMVTEPWARVLAEKLEPVLACAQREASAAC